MKAWKLWVDTGGTFTDCIALPPGGGVLRCKVLSNGCLRGTLDKAAGPATYRFTHRWHIAADIFEGYELRLPDGALPPRRIHRTDLAAGTLTLSDPLPEGFALPALFELTASEEAPILAARLLTGTALDQPLPPIEMRLGTTRGTNALLEGNTAPVVLLVTRGFADLPYIGTQQRPHLFQRNIPEPERLYRQVIEVEERLAANGNAVIPLSEAATERAVFAALSTGAGAVAVALLHAWRDPAHEKMLGEALRKAGFEAVSLSHELMPSIKLLPRMHTTLVNAALTPVLADYLRKIGRTLSEPHSRLHVMSSAGGLSDVRHFRAKDSLLSGPAGGVVGAAKVARMLGYDHILTLDMGGTSTDTARFDGQYDYQYTTKAGGTELALPCLSIETVAAGGGSVCWFDGDKLCVGPQSAGAQPGPACYGAGGPLTITDVNLLLGKLDPAAMGIPVYSEPAQQALEVLRAEVAQRSGTRYEPEDLLKGYERIANEKMAAAIRRVSVAKGFDPTDYTLLAFGGAGGLHACRIAELLGVHTIILPYDGGLLSAYGIGSAAVERFVQNQVLELWPGCRETLHRQVRTLEKQALGQLAAEGVPAQEAGICRRLVYARFQGQEHALELDWAGPQTDLATAFEEKYRQLFSHFPEGLPLEVESVKVVAAAHAVHSALPPEATAPADLQNREGALAWEAFSEGEIHEGPAILLHRFATAYLENGWRLEVGRGRNLILTRKAEAIGAEPLLPKEKEANVNPLGLELFANRFAAIAGEMGVQLQRTAFSVNIKERLDFSCALLTPDAHLLVNAPHIPVHLGSLGICARLVCRALPPEPGDVLLTNHPKFGGSHLPDLTLFSPVHEREDGGRLIGYVINRAHHAELGGSRPGSMPPDARTLVEEGVVIPPIHLVRAGEGQWETLEKLLKKGPWPSRAPDENLADIRASLASLRKGAAMLRQLVYHHGMDTVHRYMDHLAQLSSGALQDVLRPFEGHTFRAEEFLDDGHRIAVRIDIRDGSLRIDFSGSSGVHPFNLNANISIVYSVVIYVLRLICDRDIPLNEGLMRQVDIVLPHNTFLHPEFSDDPGLCPAVVGGNTEVSQRLTDTLLKALAPIAKVACSQGTMNNLLFGNEAFGYYETIGGGCGAGDGFNGRSGVHQHMTNTRITDPEELELRYPVRLWRFGLRPNSGGSGRWKGGDGIIRELEFLQPMELTFIGQHRKQAPYGLLNGAAGKQGRQYLRSFTGQTMQLAPSDSRSVCPGDRLIVETPGGGGYGDLSKEWGMGN